MSDFVSGHPASSIVIPAYNESARIDATLREVVDCIRSGGWNAEVIVVNDGSTDTTARQVLDFSITAPEVRLLENPGNHGKGYSVRHGLLQARGEIVMFTDADLSAPIREAERLFDAINNGAEIAIGSRWLDRSRQIHRQPVYRQFFGRCFNLITRMVMGLHFADTQCGFKAFTRRAAQTVFQLQTIEGWGFDPEILFIAGKRHLRTVEVPVTWRHDERTHVSYLRDGVHMLREMAIIRWNALLGRYNGPVRPVEWPTV
ncbi:dolichyl-phosphate beta-glucosyltransferase [Acidicapsa acidisoli]|uniref:dolichyl-phosphate beta-glucosyltransferase n=1 Tax=Acidicapsa acidisoli TaxID=1615681 RepID=UPI0021DFFB7A|nr:dolichyl-phosphate beta-glucosyltransferase [Acidicapsa acidisoli]